MGDSSTLRARRSRMHKRGDHALCKPDRCAAAERAAEQERPPADTDHHLGPAGQLLWDEMTTGALLAPLHTVLLLEACRIVDRLDRLDGILRGDTRALVSLDLEELELSTVRLVVTGPLSEARQQASALKQIVAELRQSATRTARKPATSPRGAGNGIADLTARIAARSSAPSA